MIAWKKNTPTILETKIVKRFAWFPTLIGDDYYWLGFYYQKYRYEDGDYYETLSGAMFGAHHPTGGSWVRDKPQMWGQYFGGTSWVEKERGLSIKDIPVYEIDNFYKSPQK